MIIVTKDRELGTNQRRLIVAHNKQRIYQQVGKLVTLDKRAELSATDRERVNDAIDAAIRGQK